MMRREQIGNILFAAAIDNNAMGGLKHQILFQGTNFVTE